MSKYIILFIIITLLFFVYKSYIKHGEGYIYNLFIIIALLFIIYKLYLRYTEKKIEKKIEILSTKIKNNITLTTYNMKDFTNVSNSIKKILLDIAYKYNHYDIINLLSPYNHN
jgi:hypothetical protein